jgi:hypothetical protein
MHLARDTGCLECHGAIDRPANDPRPLDPRAGHAECRRCHKEVDDAARCALCHTHPERAAVPELADRGLSFSHGRHLERVKGNCVRCHLEIPDAETVAEAVTPSMSSCTSSCHGEWLQDLKCRECHRDLVRFPIESIRFMSHGIGFEKRHSIAARNDALTCSQCHERSFCSDCHSNTNLVEPGTRSAEQALRNFIHPQPYRAIHALDARRDGDQCQTCHRPVFCQSCHAGVGLSTLSRLRDAPHPSGWLDPTSASFHGLEARRDVVSCAGCHDQGGASICVRCHQVGGTGGNPHPPGFSRPTSIAGNPMCRACHISGR